MKGQKTPPACTTWPKQRTAHPRVRLLPASHLLEIAVTGDERRWLERVQRPEHDVAERRRDRSACPRTHSGLAWSGSRRRSGTHPDARVFFWLDPGRLNRQRACKRRPQIVLTLDVLPWWKPTELTSVTPINTGNALRKPARRGTATFVRTTRRVRMDERSRISRQYGRSRSHAPVELTIAGPVPDAPSARGRRPRTGCGPGVRPDKPRETGVRTGLSTPPTAGPPVAR